ncbi:diacylglycerol/lipid kinase family protein [Leucobacter aridicollis]|uniref:Diacylglycerol kinase family enzyme n=1 Tax=Leucobacter aridicollis TaxID=283878 RepID=A0A852QVK8_9MICO|nr:diacylglycerol kinase family protein [Leucobacter aridicollis]MBL3683134.1 diacylglycerol kinase [Leucobacter aridicollis]NYD25361.1 diacylglycerol kinase family enzyme [Leucobacter aridicollis]
MHETIGIVWNPSKVAESELSAAVAAAVASSGREPDLHWFETTVADPGGAAAREALAAGCTVVVAAGGDGTVRAVAGALGGLGARAGEGSPRADLGIIPLGTGNLLARNLGVPLGDPESAFARVLAGEAQPLDLGEVTLTRADGASEAEAFVVMVGFGIDAQMIVETDDDLKEKAGWLAYVESLGRATAETEVVEFSLSLDGADRHPEEAHTLLVANCGTLQGGITLLPDAEPDDGELDLLVLRADGIAAWLDTMRNMVWENGLKRLLTGGDRAESSASTGHLRARTVRVELPHPHAFEVDGDDFEDVVSFEARVLPAALRVR